MYNYEKKFTFYINIWNRDILKIFAWNNFKNKWLMYQIKSLTLKMFHWCPMSPGPPPPLSCPSMAAPFWHLRRKIGLIKITIYYHDEKGKLRKNTIVCIILLIFRANRKKKWIIVQLTFFAPWDYIIRLNCFCKLWRISYINRWFFVENFTIPIYRDSKSKTKIKVLWNNFSLYRLCY